MVQMHVQASAGNSDTAVSEIARNIQRFNELAYPQISRLRINNNVVHGDFNRQNLQEHTMTKETSVWNQRMNAGWLNVGAIGVACWRGLWHEEAMYDL